MPALALVTSGLDGWLAAELVRAQGIAVSAVYFAGPFGEEPREVASIAEHLQVPLTVVPWDEAYGDLLRRPRFGYVRRAAACLDCRVAMLKRAAALADSNGADLVVTGEVVGQRSRTSAADLEMVAEHAGLAERIVRPLSAQRLPVSAAERDGRVRRGGLLGLAGRGRAVQRRLAARFWPGELPAPRPDCPLLAGPLAERVERLVRWPGPLSGALLRLARLGKWSALGPACWLVVGRNQEENARLAELATGLEASTVLAPDGFPGPTAVVVGPATEENLRVAAMEIARRGKPPAAARVIVRRGVHVQWFEVSGS